MAYRSRDVYRGRRKYTLPLMILLFALAFLLLGTVLAFYGLQQFIVYDETGVTLQFSRPAEEAESEDGSETPAGPDLSGMTVNIVYRDPDLSEVSLPVGEDTQALQAGYIHFAEIQDPETLAARVEALRQEKYEAIVFEMKTEAGYLAWASQSATAYSYGLSGTQDITETLTALAEAGVHTTARISVCADDLLAVRNWPIALKTQAGTPYVDESGHYWLDPYNRATRLYILELMEELAAMGFDEILLDDLYHPMSDAGFSYSVNLHVEPNPAAAVGQLAVKLAQEAQELGVELSVCVDAHSLRHSLAASTGQDVELFWRIFERLYCPTDTEMAASDRDAALRAGGAAERFVPICAYQSPDNFSAYAVYAPLDR